MGKDIKNFCAFCNVCQKTKSRNIAHYRTLITNPVPRWPYKSISMDFIINLPKSGLFNAMLVIVNQFTNHMQLVPIMTGLTTHDFAEIFIRIVASCFSLPDSIISNHDTRWMVEILKQVLLSLHIWLAMSSSHHPQHKHNTQNSIHKLCNLGTWAHKLAWLPYTNSTVMWTQLLDMWTCLLYLDQWPWNMQLLQTIDQVLTEWRVMSYSKLYLNSRGIPGSFLSNFHIIPESFPSTSEYSWVFQVKPELVHLPSYTQTLCIHLSLAPSLLRDFGIPALYYSLYTLYTQN